jgi:hypothetical protein
MFINSYNYNLRSGKRHKYETVDTNPKIINNFYNNININNVINKIKIILDDLNISNKYNKLNYGTKTFIINKKSYDFHVHNSTTIIECLNYNDYNNSNYLEHILAEA